MLSRERERERMNICLGNVLENKRRIDKEKKREYNITHTCQTENARDRERKRVHMFSGESLKE